MHYALYEAAKAATQDAILLQQNTQLAEAQDRQAWATFGNTLAVLDLGVTIYAANANQSYGYLSNVPHDLPRT